MREQRKYILTFLFFAHITFNMCAQSRIQNLNGSIFKESVQLNFIITAGQSCTGYQLQRSDDPLIFNELYEFSGVCGDVVKPQAFSYTDEDPLKNVTAYYRVFIPPGDFSDIISVTYFDFPESGYILFSNPLTDTFKVLVNAPASSIEIYNTHGNKMMELPVNSEDMVIENVSGLPNGLYYFQIKTKSGKILNGRFLK